jgi:hypothetical protein
MVFLKKTTKNATFRVLEMFPTSMSMLGPVERANLNRITTAIQTPEITLDQWERTGKYTVKIVISMHTSETNIEKKVDILCN